ncbi:hypothetical protein POTG_00708 [Paenibacillus sp. oral taxon 786 str. D14]|nr:hypothetical protein POTG_00708 [Paenibacillus sp. oral taxon 786 str. D14]
MFPQFQVLLIRFQDDAPRLALFIGFTFIIADDSKRIYIFCNLIVDNIAAGGRTDLVSEPFRLYNRDFAAFASPKGTLDCIAAFARFAGT